MPSSLAAFLEPTKKTTNDTAYLVYLVRRASQGGCSHSEQPSFDILDEPKTI